MGLCHGQGVPPAADWSLMINQSLFWQGIALPAYGETGVLGSLADGIFAVYETSSSPVTTVTVMQAADPPIPIDGLVLEGHVLMSSAENDSGTIAFMTDAGLLRGLHVITYSGGSLVHVSADPGVYLDGIRVSGDGLEVIATSEDFCYGYSTADCSLSWECDLSSLITGYTRGYLVGSPRAGRFLWHNTTYPQTVRTYFASEFSDGTASWSVSVYTDDFTGYSVVGSWQIGLSHRYPAPPASDVVLDGVVIGNTGGSDVFHYSGEDIPRARSFSVPLSIVGGDADWYIDYLNYYVAIDTSGSNGRRVVLYDSGLTALDSIECDATPMWVHTSPEGLTYLEQFGQDIKYRKLLTASDSLSWVAPERTITTDWAASDYLVPGSWMGQIAISSYYGGGQAG